MTISTHLPLAGIFLALLQVEAHDSAPIPPSPFDQEIVLVLTVEDPAMIEGRGPTQVVEYVAEFEGTVHIWTSSELDLFLRVDNTSTVQLLGEDDNSGGGNTPYLRFEVETGDHFAIFVAVTKSLTDAESGVGPLVLHLVAASETTATREAAASLRNAFGKANRMQSEGDLAGVREILKASIRRLEGIASAEASQGIADALWDLGLVAYNAGAISDCNEAWLRARIHRERTLPEDHPELLIARANLAVSMKQMGNLAGARALEEAVMEGFGRTLPEDHPNLLMARNNLALSMFAMGDLDGARALQETVLAGYERTLTEDHPNRLMALNNLALSLSGIGDLVGARALEEAVLAGYERTLPKNHPDLLRARSNLASSMWAMGDLAGARALQEAVLAGFKRTLPEDHPYLLMARNNLAGSMHAMGDLVGAHEHRKAVLEIYERTLPEDHPDLLDARLDLASTMSDMGDLAGAHALRESVLAGYERTLPEDHPDLLGARTNLALSMYDMGDFAGARALEETVLAEYERTLPEDHPNLTGVRTNLAASMFAMGDLVGARALEEAALASYERRLPEDHPDLLGARTNLAASMYHMDDFAGARALQESALAGYERTLPEDHPHLLAARTGLALSMFAIGDLADARALQEAVLEIRERTLPEDHPELLRARTLLASSMWQMGDLVSARVLAASICTGMRARVLGSLALSPREARQTVAAEGRRLAGVHFFTELAAPALRSVVFELTETMRMVAGEAARSLARFDTDPELAPILTEAASIRRMQGDLIAGASRNGKDAKSIAAELTRLSLERDRLEREANRRLAERGVVTRPISIDELSNTLRENEAVVGYYRLAHWTRDTSTGRSTADPDHLSAHVLRADGVLTRVDLGPADELEVLASAWRAALGAPLLRADEIHAQVDLGLAEELEELVSERPAAPFLRGVGVADKEGVNEVDAGAKLRERILDPILAAAGDDVQSLFVCADDLVFLLPLDALPLDGANDGGEKESDRVGDRMRIVSEVSFARLLVDPRPLESGPSLLALGGVDYDATGAVPNELVAPAAPIAFSNSEAPPVGARTARGTRSAIPEQFRKLQQSRYEAEATADLFEAAFDVEPALWTRKQATKAALFESAAGKRYVHLATHGWFAPESVRSTEDAQLVIPGRELMSAQDRVAGFAPMTLCGLALAGANGGRDSLRRVPGILTATELCSLDLSQCDLAVLSACETNVGIRRAGQGIQSLQAALYAAGARTSITSLWKVDDAATRRLMELFYTNLWIEEMPKSEALWRAKVAMREEGHPPTAWAGWVMTGDPD